MVTELTLRITRVMTKKCLILPTRIVGMRYVSSFEMKNMYSFTRDKILSI